VSRGCPQPPSFSGEESPLHQLEHALAKGGVLAIVRWGENDSGIQLALQSVISGPTCVGGPHDVRAVRQIGGT
jgi:hypothetical protein